MPRKTTNNIRETGFNMNLWITLVSWKINDNGNEYDNVHDASEIGSSDKVEEETSGNNDRENNL
ncbi:hypothetical protein BDA99DRAFT_495949 [Phascolomyces articulosus]|uniref:Uncharacterized protein n=1 Tax=Phascolomyces articulosus TaxID=60185 RepID=A0AAD5K9E1_9FUNG|nr:hypothetical protein BDA99DRAFT_495949 [Phascolomyces articulosus]